MEKDRFDALMRLAEFRNSRIADRRSHEWKVTIALWALLAAGMIYLRVPPTILSLSMLALALIIVVVGHAFLWVGNHWAKSNEDTVASFFYADRAHNCVLEDATVQQLRNRDKPEDWPKQERCFDFLCQRRCLAQILTTSALSVGVWLASALDNLIKHS